MPLLPALSALLRVVASTLDERAIGQTVVDESVRLLDADRSAIYFFDQTYRTMLPFVAVDRRDPASVAALFYPNPIPVDAQPLFGELLATLAPLAVADTFDDPRTTQPFFERFDTRALVLAPLLTRERALIGVFGCFWVGRTHVFTQDELAVFDALSRQAAIAFENARLYQLAQASAQATERERRRQELLAEASTLFSALLDPRAVLDQVARLVCQTLGDSATITLIDRERDLVRIAGSYQRDPAYRELRRSVADGFAFDRDPMIQQVLLSGRPLLSNDPARDHATPPDWHISSFIMVPLIAHGRVLGTLGVSSIAPSRRIYDDDDLRVLLALADRAALALENASLFVESERARHQAVAQAYELEAIFQHVPAGLAVYDIDPQFRCARHNAEFLQLVGQDWRAHGSIVGVPLRDLFSEESYEATRQIFEAVLASGQVFKIEEYEAVLLPDPLPRYYRWSLTPLKNHAGAITALLVSAIEISEQVRTRQQVQELARLAEARAAQLKTVIESIADGVWVSDASGTIVDINRQGAALLGLFQQRPPAHALPDYGALLEARDLAGAIMPPEQYPLARALSLGQQITGDLVIRNLETGRDTYLQISAAPLRDDRGTISGAVAVGRDISESVRVMRQKDEFLSVIAHELKTPVTSIKGFGQALERRLRQRMARGGPDDLFDAQELKRYADQIGTIVRQSARLQRLVDDLLDLSRLQSEQAQLRLAPLDLAQLLREVVERTQLIAEQHTLVAALPAEPIWVMGDDMRLEQALTHLLQNAIKYSPAADRVDVALWRGAHDVSISVRDYGIGIPAVEQQRLFQRFFRASNASTSHYGGLGVGLYIAAEIVRRHGGRIRAESRENEGSTFSLVLPLAEG